MAETVSVRISQKELMEIKDISEEERKKKSEILREVIDKGIKEKKLEMALGKFQNNEATASKAAKIASIPLTRFLDILQERGINFHYNLKDLREDIEDLV